MYANCLSIFKYWDLFTMKKSILALAVAAFAATSASAAQVYDKDGTIVNDKINCA